MNPGYQTPSVTARACCCPCQGWQGNLFSLPETHRDERVELPDFLGERETALKDCKDLVLSDLAIGKKHWNRVECTGAL